MRNFLKQIGIVLPILLLSAIILVIPQIDMRELMLPTQSGKAFGLLAGISGYFLFTLFIAAVNRQMVTLQITIVDLLLGTYCLMVLLSYWLHPVDQLQMLSFVALLIFYLGVRLLNTEYQLLLLIAVAVSGTIQALYGNLQLWGYYPSHHGLFRITGSFFNPGPYSGYLAAILPVSLAFYIYHIPSGIATQKLLVFTSYLSNKNLLLFFKKRFPKSHFFYSNSGVNSLQQEQQGSSGISDYITMKSVFLIAIIGICLVLPASRSRASWLAALASAVYLISMRYQLTNQLAKFFDTKAKMTGLTILVFLVLTISGFGMYHFKKDSADGRLLIWKVSSEMFKDKPLWGHGTGKFAADYMNYQAAYFKSNPDVPETMNADNVTYAYNEYIKLAVENGLIGLLLATTTIWFLFFGKTEPDTNNQEYPRPLKGSKILNENSNLQSSGSKSPSGDLWVISGNPTLLAARAGLLSILIFSLFSYPSEILPIKMLFVVFAAIVASHQKPILIFEAKTKNDIKRTHTTGHRLIRYAFLLVVLLLAYPAYLQITQQYRAYKSWKDASDIYNVGAYPECLEDFELAYPQLKYTGNFLVQYGKALEMAEKPDSSIIVLKEAEKYLNNTILYTTLGNNYKATGKAKEAEQAYNHAFKMVPSRFYPLYLLARLYDETGQQEKAVIMAKRVMEKEVKIESTAIKEIKAEMQQIVTKQASLQNSNEPKGKGQEAQPASCNRFLPGTFFPETYFGFLKKPKFSRRNPDCSGTKKESEVR